MKKLTKKKIGVIVLVIVILLFLFLTKDRQRELPYRVNGKELLEIKEKCKDLAHTKRDEWNSSGLGFHSLDGYGYSEYRGTCYAEFIRTFDKDSYKVLYDTTEEKELTIRRWTDDIGWYDSDFDNIILGKSRIIDVRTPW